MRSAFGRWLIPALACLAFASGVGAAPIEGVWEVEDGRAHIRIEPCGELLCGTVVWLGSPLDEKGEPRMDINNRDPELRSRRILGLRILEGVQAKPNRKGVWKGGAIYDADSGKTYKCTLKPDGETELILHGFIGIRLFGKSTRWTRVAE